MMQKRKRGTRLEVFLVLSVAGLFLLLATRYFTATSSSLKVVEAVNKIDTVTRASYAWLARSNHADFAGSTPITVKALVKSALLTNKDVINPWGGKVSVAYSPRNHRHVQIVLSGMSAQACEDLYLRMKSIAHSQQPCAANTYTGTY
jgi:hypothetical protein